VPVAPPAPRRDSFAERLRALEREIDEVLASAGGGDEPALAGLARDAGDELVALVADLGRAFAEGGAGGVVTRLRMIGTTERPDGFGLDPGFRTRLAPLTRLLYDRWWRVEARGVEHVPADGRALLVANHSGGLFPYDAWMIAHAVEAHHPAGGRLVRPLLDDAVYHFPFLGPWLARAGAVRGSADNARRLLAAEQAILVFPEGTKGLGKHYRDRYRLQRFGRGGFASLALRTGAPLVPVAVIGAEEIHPVLAKSRLLARALDVPYVPLTPTFPWFGLLGLMPLPTKWTITFGAPLDLAGEHGSDAWEDELLVNRLKERVRERIQRMVIAGLRDRHSVFTG
jgi:1-acyl-sn-glycerol-3-phosphate acyltransferase